MSADLPPPDPGSRADPGDAPPRPRGARTGGWAVPLVGAGALLLAAIVGYSLYQGVTGDDDSPGPAGGWDAIAVVERGGDLVLYDREGAEQERIETGLTDPVPAGAGAGTIGLIGEGDDRLTLIDIASGDVTRYDQPDGARLFWSRGDIVVPFLGAPEGANVYVPADGELTDVGAAAGWERPMIVPVAVVATDGGSTLVAPNLDPEETAIVAVDSGDVVTVPGSLVALDDSGVTTRVRTDEDDARFERFDLGGESRGVIDIGARVSGVLSTGGEDMIAVTEEGAILRLSLGEEEGSSREIDQLDVDERFDARAVGLGARPVMVLGDERDGGTDVFVVRADGSSAGPVEFDGEAERIDVGRGRDACAVISDDASVMVMRLADGDVVQSADIGGRGALLGSADQCRVVVVGVETVLLTPDRVIPAAAGHQILGVSPDGEWATVRVTPADGERVLRVLPVEDLADDGTIGEDAAGFEVHDAFAVHYVES